MIWHTGTLPDLDPVNAMVASSLAGHLGILITEIGDDYIRATMPVDARTRQPYGILHGGATVSLAETVGSLAAALCVDMKTHSVVGSEINTNHLRAVRDGLVTATAKPYHIGRRTHVWNIEVHDSNGRMNAICRLTMAIIESDTLK